MSTVKTGLIPPNWRPDGLLLPDMGRRARILLSAPSNFKAPFRVDSTSLCRPADNQGNVPSCAGWAAANHAEEYTWVETHEPVEYDGQALYFDAKKLDGHPTEDGTDGISALQAAFNRGLFPKTCGGLPVLRWKVRWLNTLDDIKYAIHRWRTCMIFYNVTKGWGSSSDGWIGKEKEIIGAHAVLGNWFDDRVEGIGWLNQWGMECGIDGNQRMQYSQHRETCIGGAVAEPVPYPIPIGTMA